MKLAIVGSRDWPDLDAVRELVGRMDRYCLENDRQLTIVSGGARGVDRAAEEEARRRRLPEPLVILPDYDAQPADRRLVAPIVRNSEIVAACTDLVAFWDGHSYGTADVVIKAANAGKLRRVYTADPLQWPLAELVERARLVRRHRGKVPPPAPSERPPAPPPGAQGQPDPETPR